MHTFPLCPMIICLSTFPNEKFNMVMPYMGPDLSIPLPISVDLYAKSKIFYPQIPSVILNTTVLLGSKSCRAAVLLLYLLSMDKTL